MKLSNKEKEYLQKILDYLEINSEQYEDLMDLSKLTGDDLDDLWRRKFVADLVIAKKMNLLDNFLDLFGYKK